jgi:hypothetical protein
MLWVLVLNLESCSSNKYDISTQAVSRCKMAGAGLHSIAKLCDLIFNPAMADRSVLLSAVCHNKNGHTAACQSSKSTFESWLPLVWTVRRVHIRPESSGWQSAEWLRADCQTVILIVANRGIRARSLAIQLNLAPTILHREAPCLKRCIFLMRKFTSLKLLRGILFGPKLYTNGLSWHTILWHYPLTLILTAGWPKDPLLKKLK